MPPSTSILVVGTCSGGTRGCSSCCTCARKTRMYGSVASLCATFDFHSTPSTPSGRGAFSPGYINNCTIASLLPETLSDLDGDFTTSSSTISPSSNSPSSPAVSTSMSTSFFPPSIDGTSLEASDDESSSSTDCAQLSTSLSSSSHSAPVTRFIQSRIR